MGERNPPSANRQEFPDEVDYKKIEQIMLALDYLRGQAKEAGSKEIYNVINSAFDTCFVAYHYLNKEQEELQTMLARRE